MKLIALIAIALSPLAFSQSISPKSVKLYQTDTLEAEQSSCDHFPFLKMDLSDSDTTFLIALCEYDITWKDEFGKPSNETNTKKDEKATPPEKLDYSFLDLSLSTPDKKELKAVGELTSDLRLNLINNPKYASVEARENWGAKSIRFGAVFIVNKADKNFTLNFAGQQSQVVVTTDALPQASSFLKVELLETELFDSKMIDSRRIERSIPGAKLSLSTPSGKLLAVKIKVTPTAPNVLGAENRYIFRPSDFMLNIGKLPLRPIGFMNSNFGIDTIYNISRTKLEDFKKVSQELTLVFAVNEDFQTGNLLFLGDQKIEVITK